MWLSQKLIPQLKTGDIIILDNATFHKGQSYNPPLNTGGLENPLIDLWSRIYPEDPERGNKK